MVAIFSGLKQPTVPKFNGSPFAALTNARLETLLPPVT